MPKTYTTQTFEAKDFTNAEDFDLESSNVISVFNGVLDAQQLPYETMEKENFVANSRIAVDSRPDGSAQDGIGIIMSTQSIYKVFSTLNTFTWNRLAPSGAGPVAVLGPPLAAYLSNNSSWATGINSLSEGITKGTFLRFVSKEGMVRGNAQVDVEYFFVSTSATGFTGNFGAGWRWQLYVFINDVMVSTTGPQPAGRRRTVNLPFSIPVASNESINVDIRWSATFDGAGNSPTEIVQVQEATIRFYNSQLWCRNQYR
jgi:hypothetical protein